MPVHRLSIPPSFRASLFPALLLIAVLLLAPLRAEAFDALEFRVQGEDAELESALRRASLLQGAQNEGVSDPFELYTIARAEYGQLIGIFYEQGYYAPVISVRIDGREAADISPLTPPSSVRQIDVILTPGPAFVFGRTELGPLAQGTSLPSDFARGEVARSTVIRDATGDAVEGWRAQGHAKAEPTDQQITARHPGNTLDVAVQIAPGPRLRFGELRPDGHVRTRTARIHKIAGLPSGDVYSPREIQRAAERLRRTGTFSSVALRDADAINPDGTLDIDAALVEAPLRRIGASIEYDTERGGKLGAFWLHRNLLGGAERFRIEAMVGGIGARSGKLDYQLALEYARPATLTPETTLKLGALIETENESDFEARRLRLDLRLEHRYSDTLTFGAGLGLLAERADFGPGFATRRDYRMVLLPLSLTWDRRDSERNPTRGFYLQSELTPFLGLKGTDSGARLTADARTYRGFGNDDRFVLAGRAQIGAILGAEIDRTPRNFLFYSGGGGSVRGQPFRSLGVDVGGVRSGGKGFAALSGEMRMRATETIGLVAFADAGYVSQGTFSGPSDWHAGAGLGLRYDTPIGPLRLDVGYPVAGPTGRGFQVYLGIGQAF
ncbi:autotransporter assembly complex protein TamA [Natronohydrobacter thiooxidans]|uniref:autotransporter assembly complex protein TamA n=1 Tax=Natronohydrobacter thiooxidans TaxID=87172 RepID=UPI000AABDDB9|nr:autotransporter assembly complex family protein [Natronohydrobacter thiooxidans]